MNPNDTSKNNTEKKMFFAIADGLFLSSKQFLYVSNVFKTGWLITLVVAKKSKKKKKI
ncbi:hypothetical protein PP707_06795 [Acetobacter pasteurianus]|nr:hypothetical protein [Acetobacter pasteurianus]